METNFQTDPKLERVGRRATMFSAPNSPSCLLIVRLVSSSAYPFPVSQPYFLVPSGFFRKPGNQQPLACLPEDVDVHMGLLFNTVIKEGMNTFPKVVFSHI